MRAGESGGENTHHDALPFPVCNEINKRPRAQVQSAIPHSARSS